MAITSITECFEDFGIKISAGLQTNTGSVTRKYSVQFDSSQTPAEEGILAYNAQGIPAMWQPLNAYPDCWYFVTDKELRIKAPHHYEVIVHYEYIENPLFAEPEISFDFVSSVEQIDWCFGRAVSQSRLDWQNVGYDQNRKWPICNSAFSPFDPPVTREFYDLIIRIVGNIATYNAVDMSRYIGAVNAAPIWGFAPGTVRCNIIRADKKRAGGLYYYTISYEFQVRGDGWLRRVIDEGFITWSGVDENGYPIFELIKDKGDNAMSEPKWLNGDGQLLKYSQLPYWHYFKLYPQINFNALVLPAQL